MFYVDTYVCLRMYTFSIPTFMPCQASCGNGLFKLKSMFKNERTSPKAHVEKFLAQCWTSHRLLYSLVEYCIV